MKQMLEENKLAEEDPTAKSSIIDKEIEERLAKLKGINPSECAVTQLEYNFKNERITIESGFKIVTSQYYQQLVTNATRNWVLASTILVLVVSKEEA